MRNKHKFVFGHPLQVHPQVHISAKYELVDESERLEDMVETDSQGKRAKEAILELENVCFIEPETPWPKPEEPNCSACEWFYTGERPVVCKAQGYKNASEVHGNESCRKLFKRIKTTQ